MTESVAGSNISYSNIAWQNTALCPNYALSQRGFLRPKCLAEYVWGDSPIGLQEIRAYAHKGKDLTQERALRVSVYLFS